MTLLLIINFYFDYKLGIFKTPDKLIFQVSIPKHILIEIVP